ncbi:phage integrase N-terminal SAM-like domain-containing protein [Stutzerimonas marianensis]
MLDQVREQIRLKHYSIRTEHVYCEWIKRYIRFHDYRHPVEMGGPEVEALLSDLAVRRDVSASTQNQALAALLFLYKQVLKHDLPWLGEVIRAKKPARLPVVLSQQEVQQVLAHLSGEVGLVARLLYGAGMRLMEGLRLRVKDVDRPASDRLSRWSKAKGSHCGFAYRPGTKAQITASCKSNYFSHSLSVDHWNSVYRRGAQTFCGR